MRGGPYTDPDYLAVALLFLLLLAVLWASYLEGL
jgi:hypothetical protein